MLESCVLLSYSSLVDAFCMECIKYVVFLLYDKINLSVSIDKFSLKCLRLSITMVRINTYKFLLNCNLCFLSLWTTNCMSFDLSFSFLSIALELICLT